MSVAACFEVDEVPLHQEVPVDDHERRLGHFVPDVPCQRRLAGVVIGKAKARQHVGAQGHHGHDPDLWIPTVAPSTACFLAAKRRAILRGVGDAHRGAVEAVERKAAPSMRVSAPRRPLRGRRGEEIRQRIFAKSLTSLADRALGDQRALPVRKRQLQLVDDLLDRGVADEPHSDAHPDHLFGG